MVNIIFHEGLNSVVRCRIVSESDSDVILLIHLFIKVRALIIDNSLYRKRYIGTSTNWIWKNRSLHNSNSAAIIKRKRSMSCNISSAILIISKNDFFV